MLIPSLNAQINIYDKVTKKPVEIIDLMIGKINNRKTMFINLYFPRLEPNQ